MSDDRVFSPDEERILTTLLYAVIPESRDGRLPGAGALELTAHIVRSVERTPMLRPVIDYGLSTLADLARKRNPAGWAALSRDERTAVFEEFTATDQFFLPAFLFLVYSGYYTTARVVEALGLEMRPPHPEGYAIEPDDLSSLLDPVRRRGKMYRD
jgi:gluconate 2-dehydrogenase subunit 3-like protein